MITEDYVSFEVAKLLKEKGFDGKVGAYYHIWDNGSYVCTALEFMHSEAPHLYIPAPTLQMAMKWLREIHKINIDIKSRWKLNPYKLDYYYFVLHYKNVPSDSFIIKFDSYEEAVEAALKYTLENLI